MPTRATWRNLEGLVPGEASHSEADPEPGWDASPPSPGVRGRAWAHACAVREWATSGSHGML